ncbi:MAG: histidine phosphatase family protein [Clostridia bacterium]|nr:histidine phosphatase family protein [Clostridia bacterium]
MLLYIIRHGDPTYNPDALTPLGLRQAEAVGRRLAVHGLDEIYASPLNRARQTAQPACEMLKLEMKIEEWTSEALAWADFSCIQPSGYQGWAFAGQNVFLRSHPEYCGEKWYEAPIFRETNAKAGYERICAASDEFLLRQGYERQGGVYRATVENKKRIAVFCHYGFGSTWISHLQNLYPTQVWSSQDISTSGITLFRFGSKAGAETVPVMEMLSDLSHLYAERLPLRSNAVWEI